MKEIREDHPKLYRWVYNEFDVEKMTADMYEDVVF